MRISFLLITIILAGCFERNKLTHSKDEETINNCEQIELEDGSLIKLNRVYFDTLNIDSITLCKKRIRSSIVNGPFKGKFFFQRKENYNFISDTIIINSVYTKYKYNNSNPTAILVKQKGCEFSLNTTMSSLDLKNFKNSGIVLCSVYDFVIHCSERKYNHLIIYNIENEK